MVKNKPLGQKSYGSIPHLPNSRLGPKDYSLNPGQTRILTEQERDARDIIIVTQKLDGSCCAVAKIDGEIVPLVRAGYRAETSRYTQHQLFAKWVAQNEHRFSYVLFEGERFVGEWMAQVHGTKYNLVHEPFVIFDLMVQTERLPYEILKERTNRQNFITPQLISYGRPITVENALKRVDNVHGAIDPIEGIVYRVERFGKVDFLAKWVYQEKIDGLYLKDYQEIWNEGLERYVT